MSVQIESRTIDGRIFVAATDVATALRSRAEDYDQAPDADAADAYQLAARELRQHAEALDFAAIVHVSGG